MQTKQCLLLPYLVLLVKTWISLVWPEADGFTAFSTNFEMHGAQIKSDTCWGAGDQTCSLACRCKRWMKVDLLQHLMSIRAQWRPWLRQNVQVSRLPLPDNGRLSEEEEPQSPAKGWGAAKPANKQLLASSVTKVFKCLSSRADEGTAFPLLLTPVRFCWTRCAPWEFPHHDLSH